MSGAASPVKFQRRVIAVSIAAALGGFLFGFDTAVINGAVDALADDVRLAEYQPYWAARAGLLARTGAVEEADRAYELAIGLESDPAVRTFLQERRAMLCAGT